MKDSKTVIVRIRKINAQGWERKEITPKIKRLAELLIETGGKTPRPIMLNRIGSESYQADEIDEMVIATKLAEQQGLALIEAFMTDEEPEFVEMNKILTAKTKTPQKQQAKRREPKPDELDWTHFNDYLFA